MMLKSKYDLLLLLIKKDKGLNLEKPENKYL